MWPNTQSNIQPIFSFLVGSESIPKILYYLDICVKNSLHNSMEQSLNEEFRVTLPDTPLTLQVLRILLVWFMPLFNLFRKVIVKNAFQGPKVHPHSKELWIGILFWLFMKWIASMQCLLDWEWLSQSRIDSWLVYRLPTCSLDNVSGFRVEP